MDERKILLFILSLIIYCLYSVHMWFEKDTTAIENSNIENQEPIAPEINEPDALKQNITETKEIVKEVKRKTKVIPLFFKNACSILQVFTEKPPTKFIKKPVKMETETNSITVIGITVFLIILAINAILDVLKAKEEERARLKLNPDGERRQSLAEFANKKPFRRESSKFGLQLFQIAESVPDSDDKNKERQQKKLYTRADSTNSYLSEKNTRSDSSAPASIGETSSEIKLIKRQSVAKLFGLSDD